MINKMQECVARQPPKTVELTPVPAPIVNEKEEEKPAVVVAPVTAPSPSRAGPITLTVGGGVVTVAGIVLQTVTRVRYGELAQQCPCPRETWLPWRTAESLSWGFVLGGAVLAAGGILWWALTGSSGVTF